MQIREITLENWIKEGHGFTADSYRNKEDENLLLKLFFTSEGKDFAEKEFRRANDVAALGVPTPKAFELVSAGGQYGIIYERIRNKRSFGQLCTDNPEKLPEYAGIFAEKSKALHRMKCNTSVFPDQKEEMRKLVCNVNIREEIQEYLLNLLEHTADADTCLHGDLQTGNLVMGWCEERAQRDGEDDRTYFIDLSTFAYGNPVFDISEMYMCTKVYQNEEVNTSILHMTSDQLEDFWKYYASAYTGSDDPAKLKEFENYVAPYAMFFLALIIAAADGAEPATETALSHIEGLFKKFCV